EVMHEMLRALGYRVAVAECGQEAVRCAQEQCFDLVILDMVMPPGIDGAETYRQLGEIRPGQRAIIVSGYAESGRVGQAQALGAGKYVRKPVTVETLARAVREELERAHVGDVRSVIDSGLMNFRTSPATPRTPWRSPCPPRSCSRARSRRGSSPGPSRPAPRPWRSSSGSPMSRS